MKRQPLSAAVLLFSLLAPNFALAQSVPANDAFKAVVKLKVVSEGPDYFLQTSQSGTGTIINADGLVLTNYHVVTRNWNLDNSEVAVGFQVCLTKTIDVEPDCSYTADLVAKDKDSDLALLQIRTIAGMNGVSTFPYVDVSSNDVSVNDGITAYGYPGIGGDTISITQGIVSGKQTKDGQEWFKTDAVTSFGSSGGAVINASGKLVGIPTQVSSDGGGSLGYAINAMGIKTWLAANSGKTPIPNPLRARVEAFTKKQKTMNDSNVFRSDIADVSIEKPAGWKFHYNAEDRIFMSDPKDDEGGFAALALAKYAHTVPMKQFTMSVWEQAAAAGTSALTKITVNEDVTLGAVNAKKLQIKALNETENQYVFTNGDIGVQVGYDYGENEKDLAVVTSIINSVKVYPRAAPKTVSTHVNSSPTFSFSVPENWYVNAYNSRAEPVAVFHRDMTSKVFAKLNQNTEDFRSLTNEQVLEQHNQLIADIAASAATVNLKIIVNSSDAHARINDELSDVIQIEKTMTDVTTGLMAVRSYGYTFETPTQLIDFGIQYYGSDMAEYERLLADFKKTASTFSMTAKPNASTPNGTTPTTTPVVTTTPTTQTAVAGSVADRMRGNILLQVQAHGEAWYVHPVTAARHYMKDGAVAYQMMRNFGLGITDADLAKIPSVSTTAEMKASTSVCASNATAKRLKGSILLQVQAHGEAWYVDPAKCRRIYMKDGAAAYEIMRFLGVGITTADLETISVGN